MRHAVVFLLACLPPAASFGGAAPPIVLLDFEDTEPSDGWSLEGLSIFDARAEAGETASGGRALGIRGTAAGGHLSRPIGVPDWRACQALTFYARVEAQKPVEIRILAIEAAGRRARLHRIALEPGAWRRVVLALSHFRPDFRRPHGRFDRIGRLAIQWDGGEGTVLLDDVALEPGDREVASCLPTAEEQMALAFPEGRGRSFPSDHFAVLSDVPAVDESAASKILARLEQGLGLLRDRYRLPAEPEDRVPLAIFATADALRAFVARLGALYRVDITPPKTDGFAVLGFAMSTWDPRQGPDRPVYVHEAMHGLIERQLLIGSDGNWIQEGLASAVQARVHPESLTADLGRLFAERATGEGSFRPLALLLADDGPGMGSYPQLLSFFEFLAERRSADLPAFWNELLSRDALPHASGIPALEKALRAPIETIGAQWLAFGAEAFRSAGR